MYIYKQQRQQTQQDNELTQGKTSIVCSKVPPSKIYTTQNWTWVANQLIGFYEMNSLLYKTKNENFSFKNW